MLKMLLILHMFVFKNKSVKTFICPDYNVRFRYKVMILMFVIPLHLPCPVEGALLMI